MSRSSAYRPEHDSVISARTAIRLGTIAWVLAAVIGVPILLARDSGLGWWLMTCAIGIISGLGGLVYLRGKLQTA
ncbi:MAG: hypothetical protein Q8L05_04435 [Actinomycetota bacterium]|nr:hypothetical protein [Actinomycetota bacterium]MDP2287053.1 hypothetical protein [Actinomycetota bacterium]